MPAPFDLDAPLAALVSLLGHASLTAAGLQKVYTGSPESFSNRVNAYVAILPAAPEPEASGGVMKRQCAYFVGIGYRVGSAEATAETTLAAVVDAFHAAFHTVHPGRDLGGTLDDARFERRLEREPLYQRLAGFEYRIVPMTIVGNQYATYPTGS